VKRLQQVLLQLLLICFALRVAAWLVGPLVPMIAVLLVVATAMALILNWRL
jgi:Na+-transporting NADH:ubiquinone oxidoreductase subunit NqrD